jgi:tRNA-specific 2-thiouridylase
MVDSGKKVAVAMSGGVDSSVAALLLKEKGFQVAGFHMSLFDAADGGGTSPGACCSEESSLAARAVCDTLGVDFFCLDFKETFRNLVIVPFVESYLAGRTPNPCVECNKAVKFEALLNDIKGLGFDYLATGHYARRESVGGKWRLRRSADKLKDQSYFLYMLDSPALESILLPLGDLKKEDVRQIAARAGLPSAERQESQDICFAGDGAYEQVIERARPGGFAPGPIFDTSGKEIGRHTGIVNYTVGQRRGMGVSAAEPLYVLKILGPENAIIAGPRRELAASGLVFSEAVFHAGEPRSGDHFDAVVRHKSKPVKAEYKGLYSCGDAESALSESRVVIFEKEVDGIAPGQSVVLYDGDMVAGGGIIEKAIER